jgi:glycerate-2-kinase
VKAEMDLRLIARELIDSAIKAVDPYILIKEQIQKKNSVLYFSNRQALDLSEYKRIFICGAGKGTAPMARAMEELLGDYLTSGDVIVKYDHRDDLKKVNLHEAGHPLPDENTLKSTKILLNNLSGLTEQDCVFVLLTGGGSSLLESLPPDFRLADLQQLSAVLLQSGATIHEINCLRKHISQIKGGQLARIIYPARCVTLALSDVIGDDLSVIASGPTSPDPSSFKEALAILEKYQIGQKMPAKILTHLQNGQAGKIPETPKSGDDLFHKVSNIVIGNNRLALERASSIAGSYGFNTIILTSMLEGEAKEIGKVISAIIREIQITNMPLNRPACVLMGGEPTVQIRGKGKGGRNQELALAVAMSDIKQPYVFVSCGSDGTDGPTDAAGAIVDEKTLPRAGEMGLFATRFLANNDSYHFFQELKDLIKTGPTGTNIMDIIIALIP